MKLVDSCYRCIMEKNDSSLTELCLKSKTCQLCCSCDQCIEDTISKREEMMTVLCLACSENLREGECDSCERAVREFNEALSLQQSQQEQLDRDEDELFASSLDDSTDHGLAFPR